MGKVIPNFGRLFRLGNKHVCWAAREALRSSGQKTIVILSRHQRGDWGVASPRLLSHNERAIRHGGPLWSVYKLRDGRKIRVWTNSARTETVVSV